MHCNITSKCCKWCLLAGFSRNSICMYINFCCEDNFKNREDKYLVCIKLSDIALHAKNGKLFLQIYVFNAHHVHNMFSF